MFIPGKWACSNCVSTLSPEEVRASIQAPSTYIPSVKPQPIEEVVADVVEPMIVEETLPSEILVSPQGVLTLSLPDQPKPTTLLFYSI